MAMVKTYSSRAALWFVAYHARLVRGVALDAATNVQLSVRGLVARVFVCVRLRTRSDVDQASYRLISVVVLIMSSTNGSLVCSL